MFVDQLCLRYTGEVVLAQRLWRKLFSTRTNKAQAPHQHDNATNPQRTPWQGQLFRHDLTVPRHQFPGISGTSAFLFQAPAGGDLTVPVQLNGVTINRVTVTSNTVVVDIQALSISGGNRGKRHRGIEKYHILYDGCPGHLVR